MLTWVLQEYIQQSGSVMGTAWLPVGRRAISCSLFPLVSYPNHSSPKVVASPKTQAIESGVSICPKYISLQVKSWSKVSPVKASMYFLDPLNSLNHSWNCLNLYQDWGNPSWKVPWLSACSVGSPRHRGKVRGQEATKRVSYPNLHP